MAWVHACAGAFPDRRRYHRHHFAADVEAAGEEPRRLVERGNRFPRPDAERAHMVGNRGDRVALLRGNVDRLRASACIHSMTRRG